MDMMLTAYGEDEEINISVPINKIIKEHWKVFLLVLPG